MALSVYFEKEDVISQLRMFFDGESAWKIDFNSCLSLIEDYGEEWWKLRIRNRTFIIHKITGEVMEVD